MLYSVELFLWFDIPIYVCRRPADSQKSDFVEKTASAVTKKSSNRSMCAHLGNFSLCSE